MGAVFPPLSVQFFLDSISWDSGGPGSLQYPYLWVAYFKIDADSAIIGVDNGFIGRGTYYAQSDDDNAGNLLGATPGMSAGQIRAVPFGVGIGPVFTVTPLSVQTNNGVAANAQWGFFGMIWALVGANGTDSVVTKIGHWAFNTAIQDAIDNVIPTFNLLSAPGPTPAQITAIINHVTSGVKSSETSAVIAEGLHGAAGNPFAMVDAIAGVLSQDYPIGSASRFYGGSATGKTYATYSGGGVFPFSDSISGQFGNWTIAGRLKVDVLPLEKALNPEPMEKTPWAEHVTSPLNWMPHAWGVEPTSPPALGVPHEWGAEPSSAPTIGAPHT